MKPAPFEYKVPNSLAEACDLMAAHGDDGKLLAGGQSLIPVMNFRLAQPAMLIDINRLSELDFLTFDESSQTLQIGAMVRQSQLEKSDLLRQTLPLISETIPYIAHSQIRNRGTVGGSLAHADPAAELPLLMVALNATLTLTSSNGEREVVASDFYIDLFETDLRPDEILTKVAIPVLPERTGAAFEELARRHGDYAMAGAAAIVSLDDSGTCQAAQLVLLNVGPKPMVAHQAAEMLIGEGPTDALILSAAEHAVQNEIDPAGDIHASEAYKRHLAKVLTQKALTRAFKNAK